MSGTDFWRDAKAAHGLEGAADVAMKRLDAQVRIADDRAGEQFCGELFAAMYEDMAGKTDPAKIVYPYTFTQAKDKGEETAYHDSRKLNNACATAIDNIIHDSCYKPRFYNLKTAAQKIISEYGFPRVNILLANKLQRQGYDGRYSRANKAWAANFDLRDMEKSLSSATMNAHPILIDSFTAHARDMFAELGAERFALPGKPEQGVAVHGYTRRASERMRQGADKYEIQRSIFFDNDRGFALAHNPAAVEPFVTWQFTVENGQRDFYWGKYFKDEESAGNNFSTRISVYLRDESAKEIDNPLVTVELSTEQNANMVDGLRNNLAQEKADLTDGQTHEEIRELAPETLPKDKPSVLEKLGKMKEHAKAQSPSPAKESRSFGEIEL